MRKALLALCTLALAGCDALGGADQSGSDAGQGSAPFFALLKEAKEAAQDGDLNDAGRLLDEAREIEPENPAVWVDIARLRFRGGEHIEALEAAEYALELGPDYAPALLLRAQFVRDAHGLTPSLVWFEAALEANPNDPVALGEYAATLGDAGYYAEMLGVTRALADISPKEPRVLYLKAVLAARAGNPVLAKSLVERSGLADAGVPSAMMLDALIDLQERNFDSAAKRLEALAGEQPGNSRVAELLARAYWLGGRDAELVERFAKAAERDEASPYLAMLVGRALERQGDRKAAAPYLQRAYQGRPSAWVALSGREGLPQPTTQMRELVGSGNRAQARRLARQLEGQFSGSADIAVLSGDAALARRDYATALQLHRKAASVRQPWPLTKKIAAAYRLSGDSVAADLVLARHAIGEPRNTEALLVNAQQAAGRQDWLRVAVLLDNAIDLGAGNDPILLELRSIAARELGEIEQAGRFERMTWDLHPGMLPSR